MKAKRRFAGAAGAFALALVSAVPEAGLSGPPRTRLFGRTLYLVELPLSSSYSNGNTWTGWAGRWVDWPLTVDRSVGYREGAYYQVTWPDFRRTLQEIGDGGLDGAVFNVSRRHLSEQRQPFQTIPLWVFCRHIRPFQCR